MKDMIKKFFPSFIISWYHLVLAFLGALFYGFPSRKLKVIGVTGTNGKTTVVEMCRQVLDEAGFKVASLSSVKFKIKDREWPNILKMTMPGRFKIQKFLRQAEDAGCEYAVLEVTSEGIRQHRHRFIDFNTAVFTNITPEHVERHGSFEKYREAKGKLFQSMTILHEDKPTGMRDGKRQQGYQVEIRCWESIDARTAQPMELFWSVLRQMADKITSEVPEVVSVTYNITPKPPSTMEAI